MSFPRRYRTVCRSLAGVSAWLLALHSIALAQTSDTKLATAQSLFDEGMRLMQSGQYSSACPKFEEGQRLAPAMGNQFHLADCYEKTGRAVLAWENFTRVADAARNRGDPAREKVARDRAKQVETQIGFVTAKVRDPLASMTIHCDQVPIDSGRWGAPLPMAPGRHVLSASAPGRSSWNQVFEIRGEGEKLEIEIPTLTAAAPPKAIKENLTPAAATQDRARTWALLLAGVGVAGLGVGAVMVGVAENKDHKAKGSCAEQCRDEAGVEASRAAKRIGDWANLPFGVGLLGLSAAGAIWFTALQSSHGEQRTSLGVSPNGVSMKVRF